MYLWYISSRRKTVTFAVCKLFYSSEFLNIILGSVKYYRIMFHITSSLQWMLWSSILLFVCIHIMWTFGNHFCNQNNEKYLLLWHMDFSLLKSTINPELCCYLGRKKHLWKIHRWRKIKTLKKRQTNRSKRL